MESTSPLVVARTRNAEQRTEALYMLTSILFLAAATLFALAGVLDVTEGRGLSTTPWTAAVLAILASSLYLRLWRDEKRTRNLRVTFDVHGVTYSCAAGTFSVTWASVHRVSYLSFGPRRIRIHSPVWEGPVGGWLHFGRLTVPADRPGLTSLRIDDTVWRFSQGLHRLD